MARSPLGFDLDAGRLDRPFTGERVDTADPGEGVEDTERRKQRRTSVKPAIMLTTRKRRSSSTQGQEGTCRYCHKDKTEETRVSMPIASHLSCVECHRLGKERKAESGPATCAGCHDSTEQMKIKKLEPVPRMERGQPDTIFVKTLAKGQQGEITGRNPVPFDHKSHEGYNDTCRVCHHASLSACNSCHALGKPLKEGNYVNLYRAMHQWNSEKSCTGCHNLQQRSKECAGCHVFIPQGRNDQSESCMARLRELQVEQKREMDTMRDAGGRPPSEEKQRR